MMRNAMNANSGATGETDALVDELLPGYRKAAA